MHRLVRANKACLNLIEDGVEFPEAEFRIRWDFKLTDTQWEAIVYAYDFPNIEDRS